MNPVIISVSPDVLFETGSIKVSGLNFESARTILLINGVSARISVLQDDLIKAEIPLLGRTDVFSVMVMTSNNTQIQPILYSNSIPVQINGLTQAQIDARIPKPIIPNEDNLFPESDGDFSSSSSSQSESDSSSSDDSSSSSGSSSSSSSSDSTLSLSSDSTLSSSTSSSTSDTSITSDSTNSSNSSISSSTSGTSITSDSTSSSNSSISSNLSESTSSTGSTDSSISTLSTSSTSDSTDSSVSTLSTSSTSDSTMSTSSTSDSTLSTNSTDSSISTLSTNSTSSSTSATSESTQSTDSSDTSGSTSSSSTPGDDPSSSTSSCSIGSLEFVQEFTAPDIADNDYIGLSARMSRNGNFLVVGSAADDIRIYRRNSLDDQWGYIETITVGSTRFGNILAISGDGQRFASSDYGSGSGGTEGTVYIYSRNDDNTYSEEQNFQASDGAAGNQFGSSLDLDFDGNTIAIGAVGDGPTFAYGAVYVYKRNGTTWTEQQKILGSNYVSFRGLGGELNSSTSARFITISDDGKTIAVGSTASITPSNGGIWIFIDQDGNWVEEQRITAHNAQPSNGHYISISSDGQHLFLVAGLDVVYYYARVENTWTQKDSVSPLSSASFADLEVSGDGNKLFVGDGLNDDDGSNAGRAFAYDRVGDTLTLNQTISSPNIEAQARFGGSVTTTQTGEQLIISAPYEHNGGTDRGNVYYYSCEGIEDSVSSSSESASASTSSNTLSSTSNSQPSSSSSSMSSSSNSNSSSSSTSS